MSGDDARRAEINELYSKLKELNPGRAAAFARDDSSLAHKLNISKTQGGKVASRAGFDTGLAHLDHYRGRDPLRAFGSTRLEHDIMVNIAGTPVSDRRRAEMVRYIHMNSHLPAATTVELLHDVRRYNSDLNRRVRERTAMDPLLQPENRAACITQGNSARYSPCLLYTSPSPRDS
eukprot:TRINITY_DN2362_c0_g1_i2.p1 TRINITY_DN2362_c0_g1~~TRINITY_DN2362_c0_g1_i2.p1  ORF type:complete len:176 (-),score=38.75 TRINITY_DN2362_c0_g1_i2:130-657(-)